MNKRKEKISAFLDNELHRDELMSFSLTSGPEDAEAVQRYQMIGEAMRGEMSDAAFVDVSQAVHEAVLDESRANAGHAAPVSRDTKTDRGLFSLSGWFRPVAGMAVAASVALVMVVTLSGQHDQLQVPMASNTNTERQPLVAPAVRLADVKAMDKKAATSPKARDLDPHLVNQHLEFATQDALQGRLPYVRAVSYQKNLGLQKSK